MTLAVQRTTGAMTDEHVIQIQQRRRSNAAGLHGIRIRGGRRAIDALAISESLASWYTPGEDDE
jgi:hypothetical protein